MSALRRQERTFRAKTAAFWDIVNMNEAPEDAELADVLDALGNPDAVTPNQLLAKATGNTAEWLMDRKNRRAIPHRMERCGYTQVRNHNAKDGYWKIAGTRQPVYAKCELSEDARRKAAIKLSIQTGDSMRNLCLDAALDELTRAGIHDPVIARGAKHLQLRWTTTRGQLRVFAVAGYPE